MRMKGIISSTLAVGMLVSGASFASAAEVSEADQSTQRIMAEITEVTDDSITLALYSTPSRPDITLQEGTESDSDTSKPAMGGRKQLTEEEQQALAESLPDGTEATEFSGMKPMGNRKQLTEEELQTMTEDGTLPELPEDVADGTEATDDTSFGMRMGGRKQLTEEELAAITEDGTLPEAPTGRPDFQSATADTDSTTAEDGTQGRPSGMPMGGGHGGAFTQELSGETLTLTISSDTTISMMVDGEMTTVSTSDLSVGDTVSVQYDTDTSTAVSIVARNETETTEES
ncbi:MAG: hypothetical protein LUG13_09710 [Oscillospiraceae bacterium]|nr:hypothetical protein [Oscillospiraceae bacterium]